MFLDAQTLLWDATALTADAASTNSYDTGAAGRDISVGEPLAAVLTVDVAAGVAGTETYEFQVIQSANADLSSPDILLAIPFTTALATTLLTAGAIIVIPIPQGAITKRYVGLYHNGANTPTITVTAAILPQSMIQRNKIYADGFTVS